MRLPPCFDMTITRADFRRLLPAAVAGAGFVEEGEAFVHRNGARGWRIELAPLPALGIGAIRLERHRVRIEFRAHSAQEIEAFMERFEMHFRRGGG